MAALAKHAEITALVQQLKEGRLSKEELFARLQALQKGVAVTGAPSTDAAVPSAAVAIAQPAMPPPAPVSHTAAAAAARHFGRDGSAPSSPLEPADDEGDGHFVPSYPSAAATAAPAAAAVNGSVPSHAGMYNGSAASSSASAAPPPPAAVQAPRLPVHRQGVAPPPAPSAAPGTGGGAGGAVADARLQRPPSAAAGQRRPSLSGGQAPGTSAGSASGTGADASGASGSATGPGGQVYTFTPRTTPLPASYGPTAHRVLSSVPFQARAAAWQRHKAEQRAAVAAAAVSRELEECTFAPTINAASQRMSQARGRRSLSAPRGRSGAGAGGGGGSAGGGYGSDGRGVSPSAATDSGAGAGGPSIHERLYRATIAAHEPSLASGAVLGRLVDAPTAMLAGGGMQAADAGAPNMTRLAGAGGGPLMIAGGRSGPGSVGRPRSAGAASSAARFLHGGRPLFTSPATGSPAAAQRLDLHGAGGGAASADDPELRECTFKPRVNPVYDARPVKSRYRDVTPSATARRRAGGASPTGSAAYGYANGSGYGDESYAYGGGAGAVGGAVSASGKPLPLPTGLSECTFKPRTNRVDAAAMPAAAMYVRAPIFERLARTQTQAQRDREKATLGAGGSEAGGHGGGAVDDDAGSKDGGGEGSAASREERERRLAAFLARQTAALAKKQAHVLAIAAALAPPLQPQLCTKSIQMAEGARAGTSFLERVSSVTAKRQQEAAKLRARQAADPDCTFAPAINPASKSLPGRGAVSLSRGDQLKRETALRLLRLRREAESLEGITFAPALNDNSRAVPGRLRVLAEPESYLQRVAAEAAMAEHKARAQAEAAHAAEMSECTFKPVVHEAPEYVKRIARSMALARAVRPTTAGSVRPDWK